MNPGVHTAESENFTTIEGMAPARLPRLGKIRLGEKRKSAKPGREYPAELKFFKFDPEAIEQFPAIRELYGDQPTELDVILPSDSQAVYFPQALKFYGANGRLKCKGNKRQAVRSVCPECLRAAGGTLSPDQVNAGFGLRCDHKDARGNPIMETIRVPIACPCKFLDSKDCAPRANLMVILPRISIGGVWQIDTGSFTNSVADIMGSIEYIIRPICGRVAMVPLKLRRTPKKDSRGVEHYPLQLTLEADMKQAARIAASSRSAAFLIEAPHDDGDDLPAVEVDDEPEDGTRTIEAPTPAPRAPQEAPPPQKAPQAAPSTEEEARAKKQKDLFDQQTHKDPKSPIWTAQRARIDDILAALSPAEAEKRISDQIDLLFPEAFGLVENLEEAEIKALADALYKSMPVGSAAPAPANASNGNGNGKIVARVAGGESLLNPKQRKIARARAKLPDDKLVSQMSEEELDAYAKAINVVMDQGGAQ